MDVIRIKEIFLSFVLVLILFILVREFGKMLIFKSLVFYLFNGLLIICFLIYKIFDMN